MTHRGNGTTKTATAAWISAIASVILLGGSLAAVYGEVRAQDAALNARINALAADVANVEEDAKTARNRIEVNQDALRLRLEESLDALRSNFADLKTNTVLICDKLKIDRCK